MLLSDRLEFHVVLKVPPVLTICENSKFHEARSSGCKSPRNCWPGLYLRCLFRVQAKRAGQFGIVIAVRLQDFLLRQLLIRVLDGDIQVVLQRQFCEILQGKPQRRSVLLSFFNRAQWQRRKVRSG